MGESLIKIQFADAYQIVSQDHKNNEALQSSIIEQEVIMKIAEKFAQQGFDDIQLVLDTLFVKAPPEKPFQVSQKVFREYITKDLKVNVSDRDIDLFFRTNPVLQKTSGQIDKSDLLRIFEYPFKTQLGKEAERYGFIQSQRNLMDMPVGNYTGQMPFFEADRARGVCFGGTLGDQLIQQQTGSRQTLGEAHLNDTLNNRDLNGMTMNKQF